MPLDLLQGWVHTVATVNPLTLIVESLRGLVSGEPFHTGAAFAAAAGLGVAVPRLGAAGAAGGRGGWG